MSTLRATICGECMAPYAVEDDGYEGTHVVPSCICDAEGVEVEAIVPIAEAWAAHRIYQESKWADLASECERKRQVQRLVGYLDRDDGLTYTEADRRKRWRRIAARKAKEAKWTGVPSVLKDRIIAPQPGHIERLFGNEVRIPIRVPRFHTVTPGQATRLYGLDVVEDPSLDESEWYVISGAQIAGYQDPQRDQYRIPSHALIPEPRTQSIWDDHKAHVQAHSLLTTTDVQRRYWHIMNVGRRLVLDFKNRIGSVV